MKLQNLLKTHNGIFKKQISLCSGNKASNTNYFQSKIVISLDILITTFNPKQLTAQDNQPNTIQNYTIINNQYTIIHLLLQILPIATH